ncbi:hypothetical protein SDC9_106642 [bioreactor metagenome]|uniref:Uncharacterized protein n=1 Tax=bioreactor metagenome TaxID=1076179 RepID=A0A645B405_9ZZZZ
MHAPCFANQVCAVDQGGANHAVRNQAGNQPVGSLLLIDQDIIVHEYLLLFPFLLFGFTYLFFSSADAAYDFLAMT